MPDSVFKGQQIKDGLPDATFREIFYNLPIPTLLLNLNKQVLAASQSFLARYGLSKRESLGKSCYEIFRPGQQECPADVCHFQAAMEGQLGLFNTHEYMNSQGTRIVEEVHLSPWIDEKGRVWGVIESVRDISEAKQLESNLRQTNELFSCLLNSMLGVVVAADMNGSILFVSQNSKRVLGYLPEELLGRMLWELSPPKEIRRLRHILNENRGPVKDIRSNIKNSNGEIIPVRVNINHLYRNGTPIGTLCIVGDLQERVKMERHLDSARMQVVQSEKLALLGRMAAGVAHELNNPLTSISIYVDLVREALPPEHPLQKDLFRVVEDADRCRDIVRDLLDYSRQSSIKLENLDLNQVMAESLSLADTGNFFRRVTIESDYAPDSLTIQGDRKLLCQMFINLLSNAMDAMEGRGRLTLRTYQDSEDMRCTEIADTGGGIPQSHLAKIFDPFFTTKEPGQGTGLGLSVVSGVVSRHGGNISVKKTGAHGTTFLVRLPAQAPNTLHDSAKKVQGDIEDEEIIG